MTYLYKMVAANGKSMDQNARKSVQMQGKNL